MSVYQVGSYIGTISIDINISIDVVSVYQVGSYIGTERRSKEVEETEMCPSIRLVPTSEPNSLNLVYKANRVSVYQVGSYIGTKDCVKSNNGKKLLCPSIRLVPTSEPKTCLIIFLI